MGVGGLAFATVISQFLSVIACFILTTLSTSNATFVGQNFGAKKIKRVKEGISKTCLLGFLASFFVDPVLGYFGVCIVEPITWVLCMIWLIFSYYSFIRKCNKKYS